MTEKRFTIEDIGNMFRVLDGFEPLTLKFNNEDKNDVKHLVELLNELHEENQRLKQNIDELLSVDIEEELLKENEQLKEQIADLETSFDICKHYKETYGDEIVHIKHTIKTMMETERTELGQSVLKQLWEQLQ